MKASKRQEKVYEVWEKEDSNILLSACAGSGKTTTLMHIMSIHKKPSLFLAFNKSIQEEITNKIEEKEFSSFAEAKTLHSLGFSSIRRSFKKKIKVDNNKSFEIAKIVQKKNREIFKLYPTSKHINIILTLVDMYDVSRNFLTIDVEEILSNLIVMDKFPFDFENSKLKNYAYSSFENEDEFEEEDVLSILWKSFLEEANKFYNKSTLVIDFNDMIFIPLYFGLEIPVKPTYLFVDECQDLNICQHKFIDKLIVQGDIEKWVAAGDKHQAIYGFSGSYSGSFDLFKTKGNVMELPLDICYRCPSSVVEVANEVFDIMTGFKKDKGIVGTITDINDIKDNSLIVCRNTSPLLTLYFKLISNHKACYIKGEEIHKSIAKFCKNYAGMSIPDAINDMHIQSDKLSKVNTDLGRAKHYKYKENFENFLILKHALKPKRIGDLLTMLDNIFKEKDGAIVLSTIHKSKGLEEDVVYILDEHLIPSKMARSQEQLIQEQNLKYVARTRAKKELYFINSEEL